MHTTTGTQVRNTERGIIATRGNRELHLLGTSVTQTEKARHLLATYSFNKLYTAAKPSPIRNVRAIKVAA